VLPAKLALTNSLPGVAEGSSDGSTRVATRPRRPGEGRGNYGWKRCILACNEVNDSALQQDTIEMPIHPSVAATGGASSGR
jgi:hypothetical protein